VISFTISPLRPYAQHERSVDIAYVEELLSLGQRPRRMKKRDYRRVYGDLEYCTVTGANNELLYDSRTEIPCDIAVFNVAKAKNRASWAQIFKDSAA
jgi:hypothetical protein